MHLIYQSRIFLARTSQNYLKSVKFYSKSQKEHLNNVNEKSKIHFEPVNKTKNASKPAHVPVMTKEVLDFLNPQDSQVFLDMTFGAGGHSQQILEKCPTSKVLCLDRDPTAHEFAHNLKQRYPERVYPLLGKFSDVPGLFTAMGIPGNSLDGVLMDLGASSMQFDNPERGFMLSSNGPLDMRMDDVRNPDQVTAADVLAHIDEQSLYKVLKYYGEEKQARKIARALIESRYLLKKLKTTSELAEFISSILLDETRTDKLHRSSHPATKTFMALRILVNNEMNELDFAMQLAQFYLRPGGILVAISFHSLEDTIIKRHITGVDIDATPDTIGSGVAKHRTFSAKEMEIFMVNKPWASLTKHVVLPSEYEVGKNPRARSSKLRAAVKI